jgi:hypothetical protein
MGLTQKLGTIPLAILTDASNNVGIGAAPSGSYKLEVTGTGKVSSALTIGSTESTWVLATSNRLQLNNTVLAGYGTTGTFLTMNLTYNSGWKYISTGNAAIYSQEPGEHSFYTSVSGTAGAAATLNERMRITNAGNVGIGTSAPGLTAVNRTVLDINGTNNSLIAFSSGGSWRSYIYNDGTNLTISCGTGAVSFINNADAERMRIASNGQIFVGTTLGLGGRMVVNNNASAGIDIFDGSNAGGFIRFFNNGASPIGSIVTTNGFSTTYNSTSDYRLKEDLKELNGLDKVLAIKIYNYKWKTIEERMDGVLAHELAEILPYAVTGEKDAEQMQGVDYSKIVPVLVKAIQELNERLNKAGL